MTTLPGQLPDPEGFAARLTPAQPAPDSEAIGRYQAGLPQEAAGEAARATAGLGRAIGEAGDRLFAAQQRIAASGAETDFLKRKLAIDAQFSQDRDYPTQPGRYIELMRQAAEQAGHGISSPALRADFANRAQQ
jgi:hypothetical protein